jgi:hypothetical protein
MAGCALIPLYGVMKKYHKTACTGLPEDEHLDVRKVEDTTIKLNKNQLDAHLF